MSAFLRRLVHELRTPLASMATVVDLLDRRDRPTVDLEETDRQARDILRRQVRLMLRRLDELSDFTRIVDGRLRLEPAAVDAAELVVEEVEAHRSRAIEDGRTLVIDVAAPPPSTAADGKRLRQIVRHLVDNALRHTQRGGRVEVSIDHDERHARIRVSDDGDGIEPTRLPSVFEDWRRVDSNIGGHGRLGLGLAMARHLAELHGGSLEVESAGAGQGSAFVLRLPIIDPADIPPDGLTASMGSPARPASTRPLRILVVEDHRFFGEAFAQALEQMDHAVSVVPAAEEALALLATLRPDIIFSDISMPGMHGHDLARALRETDGGADLVLVALTGSGDPEDRARSLAAGFDLHLVKPPDFEVLRQLFEDVTRRRYGGDQEHG
ncbi:MAG TPA: hybrid sensor histidine kinase/response regulator [Candidatus Eisenbacteria bacterium]